MRLHLVVVVKVFQCRSYYDLQECIDFLKKTGCDKKSHSTDLMGEDYTLLDHLLQQVRY